MTMTTTLDPKAPTENKLYTFNLEPRLAAKDTTITTITSVTASVGSVLSSAIDSVSSRKITVLLAGGAAADIMKVVASYLTADGQDLEAALEVPIRTT